MSLSNRIVFNDQIRRSMINEWSKLNDTTLHLTGIEQHYF